MRKLSVEFTVRVTPRSSRNKFEKVEDQFKVWVTAAPTDGQANDAVCNVVAKALNVAPSTVTVKRGQTSREKVLEIEGLDSQGLTERLADLGD